MRIHAWILDVLSVLCLTSTVYNAVTVRRVRRRYLRSIDELEHTTGRMVAFMAEHAAQRPVPLMTANGHRPVNPPSDGTGQG